MLKREESLTIKTNLYRCGKCNKAHSSRWKCLSCNQSLCDSCKKVHGKKSIFKSHSVVNLYESREGLNHPGIDVSCSCKAQGVISLYCTTCLELVCIDCIATKHNGHTFEKLEIVNKQQKDKIQSITSEIVGTQIPMVTNVQEKIILWKADHATTIRKLKDEVLRRNGKLKEQIDGWTKALLNELDDFSKTEQRKVFEFQPMIQQRLKGLIQEKDRLRILAHSNDTNLLLQGVNASMTSWDPVQFPPLNDVQYLPGPDIISNFPSPLGSFMFTPRAEETGSPNSIDSELALDKTLDVAFDFLTEEDDGPRNPLAFCTDLSRVTSLSIASPELVWIGDLKLQRLELVRITNENQMNKLCQLNMNFLDLSLQRENESLWVSSAEETSISVISRHGKKRNVKCFQSLFPTCVFSVSTDTVLVGLSEKRNLWVDKHSIRKLVEIQVPDKILLEIERDQNGKSLFTFPLKCSVNAKGGDILAIDSTGRTTGRLIVCNSNGNLKCIYTGEPSFELRRPFDPTGIACISNGNIVVCDLSNQLFHILSSNCLFLQGLSAAELSIEMPYSIACDDNGNFLVGNWPENDDQAKLYLVEESVFAPTGICI